ncbi:hypothetical protein [Pseudofulvimonas gallinarii]|uniref:Uncharacterized protein n=1 Tax=Pseudofulvimonas gallinarii TaxID=634155 RepID=A0A4S3KTQ7_9GAMM|nr:hypothetical protein [Pseudofulvimonas gallinarii]TCS97186.1 hypothetical protein EDC25_11438 [Pseudofulvimonas gallinarii]THD12539.1 hypothetical protein B1808_12450 [Pseudofulvimonas gallinarii]
MAITSLYLPPTLRRPIPFAPRDHLRREKAIELYEAGEHRAAIDEAIGYLLLPGQPAPDLTNTPLCLVQGTARVRLHIEDERLVVRAVLGALSMEGSATAALRHFLSRLSGTGQLFQPRLRGEVVSLEFEERLTLLHPHKLIEVVQRLAEAACNADSWLAEDFGMQALDREAVQALDEADVRMALEIWRTHWAAVEAMVDEVRRYRSSALLNRVADFAYSQVIYALPLNGGLPERLNDANTIYSDRDEQPARRLAILSKSVKEARALPDGDLVASLGHVGYAINPISEGNAGLLAKVLSGSQREQAIADYHAAGRSFESALYQAVDFLYLLAWFVWPPSVEEALREALDQASGRPLREAADLMRARAAAIVRAHGQGEDSADAIDGGSAFEGAWQ